VTTNSIIYTGLIVVFNIRWRPRRHDVALNEVACGGDCFQLWTVAANIP